MKTSCPSLVRISLFSSYWLLLLQCQDHGLVAVQGFSSSFSTKSLSSLSTTTTLSPTTWQLPHSPYRPAVFRSDQQHSRLFDHPDVEVETVEEAVEYLQQQQQQQQQQNEIDFDNSNNNSNNNNDNGTYVSATTTSSANEEESVVIIENELPEPDSNTNVDPLQRKQELTGEIEQLLNSYNLMDVLDVNNLANSLEGLLERFVTDTTDEPSPQEAAVSASLYMNPLTEKIASHLTVTWEPAVAHLLQQMHTVKNPTRPFLVGIVGIPGSGKSTSSEIIAQLLGDHALVLPMDGYHLSLEQLSQMPNSADAIYRRGAPDTFDPNALAAALKDICFGDVASCHFPGFDHALGDPVANQHEFVRGQHQVVICEGIYLLHDDDGWDTIRSYLDWTIYIDANVDVCIERLKERNKCIPGYTPEEIETRCEIVDRKNAELSRDSARKYASQIVQSGAA